MDTQEKGSHVKRHRDTRRNEGHEKTEAESKIMLPQDRKC